MSKFESATPVENLVGDHESSLEKRKDVIEKLANKFPKLRPLVLAFITTTAAMSAPELTHADEPSQGTRMEQKGKRAEVETAEAALSKVKDREFKDGVEKIREEMLSV